MRLAVRNNLSFVSGHRMPDVSNASEQREKEKPAAPGTYQSGDHRPRSKGRDRYHLAVSGQNVTILMNPYADGCQ